MPKIPAKIRAAAIEALDLAASNLVNPPGEEVYALSDDYGPVGGGGGPIVSLMCQAWLATPNADLESLAGAAALLRDGWSPGETVLYLEHVHRADGAHFVLES